MLKFGRGAALVAADSLSWAAERVEKSTFGRTADGEAVDIFTLRNAQGIVVRIATYGATVVSLEAPDRQGRSADAGERLRVDGTPFDFRRATPIGARIGAANPQLALGKGYDHNLTTLYRFSTDGARK